MNAKRRLFVIVAEAAVLLTVVSWILVFASMPFEAYMSRHATVAAPVVVLVPDGLATWWMFRRIRANYLRSDARRAATAFAVSAPVVLGISHVLGTLIGGYAEVIFGRYFILPVVAAFVLVMMSFIPSGIVVWALHPSAGIEPVTGFDQNDHC